MTAGRFQRETHLIARYSYGIYLLHLVAIRAGLFALRNAPLPLQIGTTLVLLAGLPVATYHLLEAPLVEFGRRMSVTGSPPR